MQKWFQCIEVHTHASKSKAKHSRIWIFGSFGLSIIEPDTIMLCQSCVVILHCRQHRQHQLHAPFLATGLNIQTSYLVHMCTYVLYHTHQIFSDFDLLVLNDSHFGTFL